MKLRQFAESSILKFANYGLLGAKEQQTDVSAAEQIIELIPNCAPEEVEYLFSEIRKRSSAKFAEQYIRESIEATWDFNPRFKQAPIDVTAKILKLQVFENLWLPKTELVATIDRQNVDAMPIAFISQQIHTAINRLNLVDLHDFKIMVNGKWITINTDGNNEGARSKYLDFMGDLIAAMETIQEQGDIQIDGYIRGLYIFQDKVAQSGAIYPWDIIDLIEFTLNQNVFEHGNLDEKEILSVFVKIIVHLIFEGNITTETNKAIEVAESMFDYDHY